VGGAIRLRRASPSLSDVRIDPPPWRPENRSTARALRRELPATSFAANEVRVNCGSAPSCNFGPVLPAGISARSSPQRRIARAARAMVAPVTSDDDGLPVSDVGEWALEKHDRLRRYVTITSAVRKKWLTPMQAGLVPPGATYIDLFCGPGRSRIYDTDQLIPGSPIVAASAATEGGAPFSRVLLADADPSLVGAARARLATLGIAAKGFEGTATETAGAIVKELDPHALHFAFLDPFKLGHLDFAALEQLAKLKRMDMLIHVSVMDFQRNLRGYIARQDSALDRFAPGWRDHVDPKSPDTAVRPATGIGCGSSAVLICRLSASSASLAVKISPYTGSCLFHATSLQVTFGTRSETSARRDGSPSRIRRNANPRGPERASSAVPSVRGRRRPFSTPYPPL
jgi:three-Cys-motif partner protein